MAVLAVGTASPASAHATLIGTDPAQGAVLAAAPDRIVFTFDEPVVGVPDGAQVFDARGAPVASSSAVSGPELRVRLTQPVADGTLVVAWRVVSEDGHPISGSLSFAIGAPSDTVVPPAAGVADATDVPRALSLARWIGYTGLFLAVGLVAFTVLFIPPGQRSERSRGRLVRTARCAAAVTVVAWLVGLPLSALYQLGAGWAAIAEADAWSTLSRAEYGVAAAVSVGVCVAVVLLGDGRPDRRRGSAALAVSLVAVGAPAFTGHPRAASPEALVIGADVLHLVAGCVWLGGLVGLALTLPDLSRRGTAAGEVLARFSGAAAALLVALVATGSLLAWRIVGSWSALVDTGYGQLLLVKVAVAAVAVLLAAWNRYALLPRLREADGYADRRSGARHVARATAAEAALLVVVLLVTGFLVSKSPGPTGSLGTASDAGGATTQTAMLGHIEVRATMSPARTGANTLTLELVDHAGAPADGLPPPRVRLSSDLVDLGAVPLTSAGAGRYTADAVLPAPGAWEVQVSLRIGKFDNPVVTLPFTVAAG